MSVTIEGPRAPLQKRSEATLARILDAARALLAVQDIDDITVEDIARQAGVSVGSLYTRFRSKDELLTHLLDVTQRTQAEQLSEVLAEHLWQGVDLPKRLAWLVEQLQSSARAQPGLIRAVFGRLLSRSAAQNAGPAVLNARCLSLISTWLAAASDPSGPDPAVRIKTTVACLSYSIHLALLYDFAFPAQDKQETVAELHRAALAALAPSPSGSD